LRQVATVSLLAGTAAAAGWGAALVCPADKTVIVKSIFLVQASGTPGFVDVMLNNASNPNMVILHQVLELVKGVWWNGWLAMSEPGDTLGIYVSQPSISWWVSGTMLEGNSTYVRPPGTVSSARPTIAF
jgi:hypothetical protein